MVFAIIGKMPGLPPGRVLAYTAAAGLMFIFTTFVATIVTTLTLAYALYDLSPWRRLKFELEEEPAFEFFFKKHVGPYSKVGTLFEQIAETHKHLAFERMCGIYTSNPVVIKPEDQNAYIGIACTPAEAGLYRMEFLASGLEARHVPKQRCMTCHWRLPWLEALSMVSIIVAVRRVYKRASDLGLSCTHVVEFHKKEEIKFCFALPDEGQLIVQPPDPAE
jgi:hypothetical protein